jgi:hypothetical protein
VIFEVKIAAFAIENFLSKGLGLQCSAAGSKKESPAPTVGKVAGNSQQYLQWAR